MSAKDEMSAYLEEIFCLRFELKALSETAIRGTSERWIPGFSFPSVEVDHEDRYQLAAKFVQGKNVLDLACGAGKGSLMLAQIGKASHVLGGDLNEQAIRYASHRHQTPNVKYRVINAMNPDMADLRFDTIVSFETIEHLPDAELFLKNCHGLLESAGEFIVSTPISFKPVNRNPYNPYHTIEWGFLEFQKLLAGYFQIKEVYVQLYPKLGIKRRLLAKIFRTMSLEQEPLQQKSRIEKYVSQYPTREIGRLRTGYQVLVCGKSG